MITKKIKHNNAWWLKVETHLSFNHKNRTCLILNTCRSNVNTGVTEFFEINVLFF